MACPSVPTGGLFLETALAHLDCQAQTVGSFGFQALAAAGSPASLALSALLTLFIALLGIRLLFGADAEPHDAVGAILKIGVVLTLAMSWPAFRVIAYETVLKGPAEVAAMITPTSLPDSRRGFAERLQAVDQGIATLTAAGTGRQTGSLALEKQPDGAFRAIALPDETALGWARMLFLSSVIGSLAALRIGGGLLLALGPLFAGLLLFDLTRGLFAGWLRGLVLTALGSLGMTVLLAVQAALLEPWLTDVLSRRSLGYATPSAPTELLALNFAFAVAGVGLLVVLGKVSFQQSWVTRGLGRLREASNVPALVQRPAGVGVVGGTLPVHSRAAAIAEAVSSTLRREEHAVELRRDLQRALTTGRDDGRGLAPNAQAQFEPLSSRYRRASGRQTRSAASRDQRR